MYKVVDIDKKKKNEQINKSIVNFFLFFFLCNLIMVIDKYNTIDNE